MKTISEKVAYIEGLTDGLKIDGGTNEGKIILALIDVLKDVAAELEDVDETLDDMAEIVSDIEESVYEIEDEIFGSGELPDYDFEDNLYEITCRNCDNTVSVDAGMLEEGFVKCPNCGSKIEFDIDIIDSDECDSGHDR
ncbi:MAG: hypothetical protein LBI38_05480 [Oscillospiraceae bacterium]|jgi:DNA-directed RNA polymerase subunit RPC12/RpoP|nr:hypothetical protein [Oscillospiraceae bacterium]